MKGGEESDDPEMEVPMAHRGGSLAIAVTSGLGTLDAFAHLPESDICFLISNQRDTAWFQRLKTGTRVANLMSFS